MIKEKSVNYLLTILLIISVSFNLLAWGKIQDINNSVEKSKMEIQRGEKEKGELKQNHQDPAKKLENQQQDEINEKNLVPREVVQKFAEQDSAGARLGGAIAEKTNIKKYATPNFLVGGREQIMIIKKYEITKGYFSEDRNRYYVKVKYFCDYGVEPIAIYDEKTGKLTRFETISCASLFLKICPNCFEKSNKISSINFDIQNNVETVTFELVKENNNWLINSPSIPPHILEETLKKHTEILK